MFDLAVRGAMVFTPRGRAPLDVYVSAGQVVALEPHGSGHSARRSLDADGLWALPGMVDTHVHLMEPGDPEREDFETGTTAAAMAGVTTIVEHTHAWPVTSAGRLAEKLEQVGGRSHVDFGLAAHVWPDAFDQLRPLWEAGITFFKLFTCSTHGVPGLDSGDLLDAFEILADLGGRALVHCEDESLTRRSEQELRAAGRTDPRVLPSWRSPVAEAVAVATVCELAVRTGVHAAIAHASSRSLLDMVADARRRGANLVAETCPQYLLLREDTVDAQGAFRKFTPPARSRSQFDDRQMWDALNGGLVHHLSTDHAPSTAAHKCGSMWEAPFGLPGLDTTLPVLLDAALKGWTAVETIVELYSRQPARWYGLTTKGRLSVGADADIVLVDPDGQRSITADGVRSRAGWSPFEGLDLRGEVVATVLRGLVVVRERQLVEAWAGRFVPGPGLTHRSGGERG